MKIEIYDPAMCCSSGICRPSIDPVLMKVNETVKGAYNILRLAYT
ncbi:MAG: arsenic metallochaperone ArsD family protein [Nitrospirota bacterium]